MIADRSQNEQLFITLLFVFFNYYNPFSVVLTLAVNTGLLVIFLFFNYRKRGISVGQEGFVIYISAFVLFWTLAIMFLRMGTDLYVLGKYTRVFIATLYIFMLCALINITPHTLRRVLSVIFFLHLLAVIAQTVFPSINIAMANVFGMSNSSEFFLEYKNRKMGLSSSFDTASLISVAAMVFYFINYQVFRNKYYLLLIVLACFCWTMSSRTGMVLGALFFVYFAASTFNTSKGWEKMLAIVLAGAVLYAGYQVLLPIFAHTFELNIATAGESQVTVEYGTRGTLDTLLGDHLAVLFNINFIEAVLGLGLDPDGTDIGYVKLIFHVGIIGTIAILLLYFRSLINAYNISKRTEDTDVYILSRFLGIYILLLFIMNYKSLEIYSRGAHEMLLIVAFALFRSERIRTENN
ncbi:hypothetical protein [Pseudoalteromonas luteoviolacea]|uniref:Uncharacterized protein n=1 Tax=Pseudoalteromonas luteoviolacea S4060-1 TaxID=1365257 RepID=A0A161YYY9_9GAMM|nr:hypothetical protein [Pseudoalteromonas luteoviolacea]KZN29559.1 hypothetical protein N480_07490 [Pseudoalteromonas luteoviolacea S2607]KZN68490.1 hypothetical protein N478_15105 [Pseudoalteromonas luteoviolacea S4060-1]